MPIRQPPDESWKAMGVWNQDIFLLLAEAGKHVLHPTLSSCLAKTDRHLKSAQEISLDHLASVANGVCFPGPHRPVTIRKTVLADYHPQDTAQTVYWNTLPVLLRKRPFTSYWRLFSLRDRLLVCHISRGYISGNIIRETPSLRMHSLGQ